jgi:hypothetical protein
MKIFVDLKFRNFLILDIWSKTKVEELQRGIVTVSVVVDEGMVNPYNTLHGALYAFFAGLSKRKKQKKTNNCINWYLFANFNSQIQTFILFV